MDIQIGVADGVHRLSHAYVNCYLVEDESGVTLVDAGLPAMWPLLGEALGRLGRRLGDIRALVLTHGHFDHLGFAARLRETVEMPAFVHARDAQLAAHPYSYRPERNRLLYVLTHPGGWGPLARMTAAGALSVKGVDPTTPLAPGQPLDVPGSLTPIATPGHTNGHCAFLLPGRDTVLSGDALVTLDPYTGKEGPQVVATAATSDSERALASLEALADTGVTTLLSGHGEPWTDGAGRAVEAARQVGAH